MAIVFDYCWKICLVIFSVDYLYYPFSGTSSTDRFLSLARIVSQCSGYARFELQVDNIPHRKEDTIYGNGLLFEVQYCPDIVQGCLPIIRSYKGAVAPASYSTMSGVKWIDLLSGYSTKERVTSPTLFVLKVPFEVPHNCGTALFIVGMYF